MATSLPFRGDHPVPRREMAVLSVHRSQLTLHYSGNLKNIIYRKRSIIFTHDSHTTTESFPHVPSGNPERERGAGFPLGTCGNDVGVYEPGW
jgi:hypothetical protein